MVERVEPLQGQAVSIHALLTVGERRYRAPEFQRHYVWGEDTQIKRFWDDLNRMKDEGIDDSGIYDSLFLGAIVTQAIDAGGSAGVPLFSIIDGQQRLTTLYLALVAIAEGYQDAGDPDKANDIERRYLLSQHSDRRDEPRLEPTMNDTAQFRMIMSCLQNPRPVFKSPGVGPTDRHMIWAWAAIRRKVRDLCADERSGKLSVQKLAELHADIVERIEIVSITIGDKHDPHEVYERLNTGGQPLKVIDLTRNAVFLTAGHERGATERIYRDHWGPFEEELGINHQDNYFFPYALIRDQNTTKARMYRSLKSYWEKSVTQGLKNEEAAKAIVNDLREYLLAYRALVGEAEPANMETEELESIKKLHRLSAPSTMHPYLLQLIHNKIEERISAKEMIEVIDVLDSFIIRRMFCGFGNTGIHTLFKRIWSTVGADAQKLTTVLGETRTVQFPDDEDFHRSILTASIFRADRCAYVLTEYERSFRKGDLSEWDPHNITVDHLLPQKAALKDWPGVSNEDHERLLDTWANLVPLTGKANSEKSARPWKEIREMMLSDRGTVFKSTLEVFDANERWDTAAIEARGEKLADWALQRWPKPI